MPRMSLTGAVYGQVRQTPCLVFFSPRVLINIDLASFLDNGYSEYLTSADVIR